MTEPTYDDVRSALLNSSQRLASTLSSLRNGEAEAQSYDDDWTIGQVASHIGSGSQIFGLFLQAGRRHDAAPGIDAMRPIWEVWNAKTAEEQVKDALVADTSFFEDLDALTDDERRDWQLDLFGSAADLTSLIGMRMSEHAVHTWDIVVALDPAATVADDAVALILDRLSGLAARAGKPADSPILIRVVTSNPAREFLIDVTTDSVAVTARPDGDDRAPQAVVELPAEAFIRLVYGRLDDGHTPAGVTADGVDLDFLRSRFPGF